MYFCINSCSGTQNKMFHHNVCDCTCSVVMFVSLVERGAQCDFERVEIVYGLSSLY